MTLSYDRDTLGERGGKAKLEITKILKDNYFDTLKKNSDKRENQDIMQKLV